MVLGRGHGLDGPAIHIGKHGHLPSCDKFFHHKTVSRAAELLILHNGLNTLFCLLKILTDQHALSKGQAVSLKHDRKFGLFQIGKGFLRGAENLIIRCGNMVLFHKLLGKSFAAL